MPYIKQEDRPDIKHYTDKLCTEITSAGDLNYTITRLLHDYINIHGENYDNYNRLIGVLDCVSKEFYRRKVVPYEDKKIQENGDI